MAAGSIKSSEEARRRGAKTQFKKGQSGNPNGQPKKIPALDQLLADVLSEEQNGIEAAKAILMALRKSAIKGDVRAAEVLLDRAYGKAKQTIDVDAKVDTVVKIGYGENDPE